VKVPSVKGREGGVRVNWLREEFCECPPGANEATVTLYARARVWHMFATVLLPYGTCDMVSLLLVLFQTYFLILTCFHSLSSRS
jgi:hypothetical protein